MIEPIHSPDYDTYADIERRDLPSWFTEISREQRDMHEQLAERVIQLRTLLDALSLSGNENEKIADLLAQALHLLDYTRPYNISVIGMSGVGKSTLINALLGRDLLPSRHGLATTGTIVTVSQTVVQENEPEVRHALIHYHTHQTLTKAIEALCAKLNIEPLYTSHKPPFVHVGKTLQLIQALQICPSCQSINQPSAIYCSECASRLETADSHTNLPSELIMLVDLLQTAHHQRSRLEQKSNPAIIPLNSIDDIRRVQALMDEESPTNKKGSSSRIIPLIRHIDYQISTRQPRNHDGLAYINLTDTPGSAALTVAHDEQLRKQLNPFATDAIILVMKPHRPEAMIREMVPLIENLLMRGLKANERHLVAERTFLVVNKADEIAPEMLSDAEQDVREGVEKVGDKILTGFCGDQPDHVFYSMKAQPALIAELILTYPDAGQEWLRGGSNSYFRFNPDYYLNVSSRAQREHSTLDREEAVLRWSQIRELRHSLKTFLGRRWETDLKKAQALYHNAHGTVCDLVESEWIAVTGQPFSASPHSDLEQFNRGQALRYAQELRKQVRIILERFRQACSELRYQQRTNRGAEPDLESVRNEIQRKIANYTDTTQFKRAIMNMIEHPIFSNLLDHAGAPQPLIELDTLIYQWIDGEVRGIATTMMDKLRQELEKAQVENALQEAYYQLPTYDNYLTTYQNDIIAQMHFQYENASRGAILYQMMTRPVVKEIRTDAEFHATISQRINAIASISDSTSTLNGPHTTSLTSEEIADVLVSKIREKYATAHSELIRTMPTYLAALFFYHLTDAEKKLVALVEELTAQLSIDVGNTNGPLYRRILANESSQSARRARLYEYWQELQELK